jgi:PAS domain S-box-containing protein
LDSKNEAPKKTANTESASPRAQNASSVPPTVSASSRPRFELPWLVLLALLIGTVVAAYKSEQRADAAASKRFQEISRAAQVSLQHELQTTKDLLESTAAFVSALPNASMDARGWSNLFKGHAANGNDRSSLIRIDYLAQNTAIPDTTPMAVGKLSYSFKPLLDTASADLDLNTIPAVALTVAEAAKRAGAAVSTPIKIPAKNGETAVVIAIVRDVSLPKIAGEQAATTEATGGAAPTRTPGHLVGLVNLDDILAKISSADGGRINVKLLDEQVPPAPLISEKNAQFSEIVGGDTGSNTGSSTTEPWKIKISSTPQLDDELRDSSPKFILVVGIIGSILLAGLIWLLTRLRQQAESLSESMTDRLRDQMKLNEDIIEFNPSPIYRKDTNGRFIAVNRAWEQLSGYRRADIIGKRTSEIQKTDLAAQNDAADRKLYEIEGGYDVSERLVTTADGRTFETMVAKQLVRRADGTVDGLIGTITDLSPVRRLEREIALQREQLDLVISASQQGIWDVELHVGGNAYFSSAFRDILGYASGGFPTPFLWENNIHPDDHAAFGAEQIRHFKGKTPFFDFEARVLRRDGSYVWVRTRAIARRNAEGRAIRFVGSIVDISDRKEAEKMLIEGSSRIAEAAKAKEAFLATMSHEIRTPLNGVLGMAALLADTPLNEEQHDYIRLIRASGDTLLNLINDILDFSKIEAGHMSLESVAVEVIALIEETFEIVAEKAREKRIALVYDVRDDVPFYILGDATRLRQILLNLLSNAIKFTEGGEVKLSMTAQRNQAGKILLEGRVQDTGVGINEEQIAKLFTPFTQADASTTRKFGGTGLGLAIVKRLTEAMQGNVRVESKLGYGATFIFTIETQQARGPLRPYMQREVFDFLGKKILVVDSVAARRSIRHYRYTRWGFDTITVAPDDAAATLRAKPGIDIVVTDFVQPSPEAMEFQAVLTANDNSRLAQRDKRIISVLLSSGTRSDLARQKIVPALRHDFFLVRPVNTTKLFDALMRAVLGELGVDKTSRPYSLSSEATEAANLATTKDTAEAANAYPALSRVPATFQPQSTYPATTSAANASATAAGLNVNKSKADEGTNAQLTGAAAKHAKPNASRRYNVLVAEDNEVNQRVIEGMLKNLGHHITLVSDGRAAVEAATRHDFDVILMDIQMPVLDGSVAMREIRAHFANIDGAFCPPIVAMTAHALAGDKEGYLADGMDDYLSKPIRLAEVAAVLERTAGQILPPEKLLGVGMRTVQTGESAPPAAAPPSTSITASASVTTTATTTTTTTPPKSAPTAIPATAAPSVAAPASAAKSAAKPAMFARSDLATRVDQLPLLDIEQLEDLRYLPATPGAAGDASDPVGGLIRLFQSKAVERMDIIENCLAHREWKALSEVAHSLRGASASMGFPRVASLCKDLELASRQLAEANADTSDGATKAAQTKGIKLASQSELDEIFELTRYYYHQADVALHEWLAKPSANSTPHN